MGPCGPSKVSMAFIIILAIVTLIGLTASVFAIAKSKEEDKETQIEQSITIDVNMLVKANDTTDSKAGTISGDITYSWDRHNLRKYGGAMYEFLSYPKSFETGHYNDDMTTSEKHQAQVDSFKQLAKFDLEYHIATSNGTWTKEEVRGYLEDKWEGLRVTNMNIKID